MNSPNELFDRIGDPTVLQRALADTSRLDSEMKVIDWSTFNLKEVQLRNECRYVEQALEEANGSVTKAAELLGLASHQSLLYMLNGRLKNRINPRTPIKRRRRSVMPKCAVAKS